MSFNIKSLLAYRWILVHVAIIVCQICWGTGSVIAQLSLNKNTNPVFFSAIRQSVTAIILVTYIYSCSAKRSIPLFRSKQDMNKMLATGFCLYMSQLSYIVGLKLSSSTTASSWQPFQGLLAVVYEYLLGIQPHIEFQKVIGIAIGTCGAVFMVMFHDQKSNANSLSFWSGFGGSLCFFINNSASVFYLIFSSSIARKYSSVMITTYAYVIAAILMAFTIIAMHIYYGLIADDGEYGLYDISMPVVYTLVYFIIFGSIVAHGLLTWANQYLHPSNVTAYWILQPFSAVCVSQILLFFEFVPDCNQMQSNGNGEDGKCLFGFGINHLSVIPILIGLYIVLHANYRRNKENVIGKS